MLLLLTLLLAVLGGYLVISAIGAVSEDADSALKLVISVFILSLSIFVAIWATKPQAVRIPQNAKIMRVELVNTETGVDTVFVYGVIPENWTAE